ncbi:hypothetical protein [Pedobacter sp.]|uniref:hypothetical protein n=1 Tax=Pedobacter sp. TaxID=1411316 RepID=UPI0031DEF178
MEEIVLTVTRGGNSVNSVYSGPANWKQMQKEHLMMWASAMCSNLVTQKAKIILAALLFKIPKHVLINVLPRHERIRLSFKINFLFKKNELSAWLIPSFWFGFRKYYGPKNKLSNLTTEEFGLCELCWENFQLTKDQGFLDVLIAILYRPRRFFAIDDDIRQPLRNYSREIRTRRFKKLSEKMRWSVYLNYEGCRNYITGTYKQVFKSADPGEQAKPASWTKVVQSAAGGIFGNLKETEKSNVHKFLSELNDRLIQMEKDKKP